MNKELGRLRFIIFISVLFALVIFSSWPATMITGSREIKNTNNNDTSHVMSEAFVIQDPFIQNETVGEKGTSQGLLEPVELTQDLSPAVIQNETGNENGTLLEPAKLMQDLSPAVIQNATGNKNGTSQGLFEPSVLKKKALSPNVPFNKNLWIHVERFGEGLSSWRIALAQVLMVAKRINATLVEPCIVRGSLATCRSSPYTLSQLLDVDRLRRYHPMIVPYSVFDKVIQASHNQNVSKIFNTTMCFQNPTGNPPVERICGNLTNRYGLVTNKPLNEAIQRSKKMTSVIHISFYRRDGFLVTKVDNRHLVDKFHIPSMLTKYFSFAPEHYRIVDNILERMGFPTKKRVRFDVIHWRSELFNGTFDYCADLILKARRKIKSNRTIIMSSINPDMSLQWFPSKEQNQAVSALRRLLDDGFLKVDEVLNEEDKSMLAHAGENVNKILLAIWDQIIAEKADRFVTCTRGCSEGKPDLHPCSRCNYPGQFSQMAVDKRKDKGKSSIECWPL